jgi:hypothetical protein
MLLISTEDAQLVASLEGLDSMELALFRDSVLNAAKEV